MQKVFSCWIDINNKDNGTIYVIADSHDEAKKILLKECTSSDITGLGELRENSLPAKYWTSETYAILGSEDIINDLMLKIDEEAEEKEREDHLFFEQEKELAAYEYFKNGAHHFSDGTARACLLNDAERKLLGSFDDRVRGLPNREPLGECERLDYELLLEKHAIENTNSPTKYRLLLAEYKKKYNIKEISPYAIKEIYCGLSEEIFEFDSEQQMEAFFVKKIGNDADQDSIKEGKASSITGWHIEIINKKSLFTDKSAEYECIHNGVKHNC